MGFVVHLGEGKSVKVISISFVSGSARLRLVLHRTRSPGAWLHGFCQVAFEAGIIAPLRYGRLPK